MLYLLFDYVTFGKKPEATEGTRRLAEKNPNRPLFAPLSPCCTVTFSGSPKQFGGSPTGLATMV
ncbi:hypothetical protein H5410_021949 [Solanum commersonii]|uniref:Uncharacterized protein n=1 Tax=Solanum commersonii TaxID=4109 RepID=A0A9J5ZGQ4_SOLCO|nr:hypothetical protein H5410_021949 [Solanum commersonii]